MKAMSITGREVAGLVLAERQKKKAPGRVQENQYQLVFEIPRVVVNGVSFIDVRIEDIILIACFGAYRL